jgi:hypothetical protein
MKICLCFFNANSVYFLLMMVNKKTLIDKCVLRKEKVFVFSTI